MALIDLKNVTKIFGSNDTEVVALRDVNLQINRGEMIAVVGTSGSGKSTLLNLIGTLESITSGEYQLENSSPKDLKQKELAQFRNKYFGFVVQHFALISDYTVCENIEIPLEYARVKKSARKKRIQEVLIKLNLQDKTNKRPTQLSGGQCQRVAIARSIVNNPEIILADEPTGALDKQTGQQVIDIFKELNKEGKTVIIVTHDINIASQCNRIIKIEDGRVIDNGYGNVVR